MAYTRLMRAYYRREKPLEGVVEACRLIRATSVKQRRAVETVLHEFFTREADGWHSKRCDKEIAAYQTQADHNREVGNLGGRPKKTQVVSKNNHSGLLKTEIRKPNDNPNQEPLTKNQEPVPTSHKPEPEVKTNQSQKHSPGVLPTVETWNAYSQAYEQRYGVEPVRNASVNGMLAQFVTRIPASEAPLVAAFYLTSNRSWYVQNKHSVSMLLKDAEGLRTEWATGVRGTDTEARMADRTQATGNAFAPLIAEARERERVANGTK